MRFIEYVRDSENGMTFSQIRKKYKMTEEQMIKN